MTWMVMTGVLLGGAVFVDHAEAGDRRKHERDRRIEGRHDRHVEVRYVRGDGRYFRERDVYVVREYYRPYYRPLPPGLRKRYYRTGHLPPGWAKRMRPVPVYIEREMVAVPRGYRRGIIDGHVVVYNPSGLIVDVAVLF
jgi:hypothetical protein